MAPIPIRLLIRGPQSVKIITFPMILLGPHVVCRTLMIVPLMIVMVSSVVVSSVVCSVVSLVGPLVVPAVVLALYCSRSC
jgi:hypothetical protein